jgi:hypothetical protein
MALTKQIVLKSNFGDDVVFNNAYITVQTVFCTKSDMSMNVLIYKEQNGLVIDAKQYFSSLDLTGLNPIKQAYGYLKTLPEFEGATDC